MTALAAAQPQEAVGRNAAFEEGVELVLMNRGNSAIAPRGDLGVGDGAGHLVLNTAENYVDNAPWMAIWPGLAIFLLVLSFNLLGDGLRDAFDPGRS